MRNRPLCSVCLIVFVLLCVSILAGGEKFVEELRPSPLECNVQKDETIQFTGQVYQKEIKDNYQVLYLKNVKVTYQKQSLNESRVIVYDEGKEKTSIGNKVKGSGKVSFYEPSRNPGNFDQKLYYQKQHIHASVWAKSVQVVSETTEHLKDRLYGFRRRWNMLLCEVLGEKDGSTFSAILLGEKSGMDREVKELYQVNGIAHILAISGLHLSLIGVGIYQLLRRVTGSYPIGGIFGILFLLSYILMIGFTVSAVRALVMFLFRVGADMAGRHYDSPTALSVAAVIVLFWRPLSLYDGGFWLSFGAVLAILTVVPVVQGDVDVQETNNGNRLCGSLARSVWQRTFQGLTASIGINLVIFPILLYYFFEFPLYSFVLNLLVIPLVSALIFLGMAGSLSALWFPFISNVLFLICRGILRMYEGSCNIALRLPGARLIIGRPEVWKIMVYYVLLLSGVILMRTALSKEKRKRYFAAFLWIMGLVILTTRFGEEGKLTTVVLDVGQGDGIFMKGPEGGTYLVDGGSSDIKNVGQYRLESFLKSQGVGVLDYIMVSHGDSDHMNGIEELIERNEVGVKIRTLVLPVQEVWDEALAGLAKKAKKCGIRVTEMKPGQSIKEGKMTLTCIQPGNVGKRSEGAKTGNTASMVLAVRFGEFDMLLTGDVEGEGEEQLTKRLEESYQNCTWEVLKAAHHGSKNSSTEEFLQQIQPAYAFISAGQENRYGHPHQETIERFRNVGSKIYSTQEKGALIVEVEDGKTLEIEKY